MEAKNKLKIKDYSVKSVNAKRMLISNTNIKQA